MVADLNGFVMASRDIFRVFDSLNYIDNLMFGIDAVRALTQILNSKAFATYAASMLVCCPLPEPPPQLRWPAQRCHILLR